MTVCRNAAAALNLFRNWCAAGRLGEVLPEVEALRDVPQDTLYHQEGDALAHTLLAVAQVKDEDDERVFWAVLLHDIGKAATTRLIEGRWRSRGHCRTGAELAKGVLERLGQADLAPEVAWLVRHHQFHLNWNIQDGRSLSTRQQRFCSLPLFPLLVRVAGIDALASRGASRKGEILQEVVKLAAAGNK